MDSPTAALALQGVGPGERKSRSTGQRLERERPQGSSPLDQRDSAPVGVVLVELMISLGTREKFFMLEVEFLCLSSVRNAEIWT